MEWISVEHGLPAEDTKVLCFGKDNQIFTGEYRDFWASDNMDHIEFLVEYEPVTHWMPLPEPPKEETTNNV